MALVEAATADKAASVIEKPIEAEVTDYWKANEFTNAEPIAAAPVPPAPTAAAGALPPSPSAPAVDWGPIRARLSVKNSAIIGASAFILVGTAFEAASFLIRSSNSTEADELLDVGALWAAVGIPILIFSFSVDPLKGVVK
jgi:hypothetical protein